MVLYQSGVRVAMNSLRGRGPENVRAGSTNRPSWSRLILHYLQPRTAKKGMDIYLVKERVPQGSVISEVR